MIDNQIPLSVYMTLNEAQNVLIGIIQNRLHEPKQGENPISGQEAIDNYLNVVDKFYNYYKCQHSYLIDKIKGYNIQKFSEKLKQKSMRIKNVMSIEEEVGRKIVVFGALMEVLLWSVVGHSNYKPTQ